MAGAGWDVEMVMEGVGALESFWRVCLQHPTTDWLWGNDPPYPPTCPPLGVSPSPWIPPPPRRSGPCLPVSGRPCAGQRGTRTGASQHGGRPRPRGLEQGSSPTRHGAAQPTSPRLPAGTSWRPGQRPPRYPIPTAFPGTAQQRGRENSVCDRTGLWSAVLAPRALRGLACGPRAPSPTGGGTVPHPGHGPHPLPPPRSPAAPALRRQAHQHRPLALPGGATTSDTLVLEEREKERKRPARAALSERPSSGRGGACPRTPNPPAAGL